MLLVELLATQVEEAVLEPCFFWIFLIAEHRHGQLAGGAQHLDFADVDLDLAGRQVRILGAARTAAHLAVDPHHPLRTQRLGDLEGRAVGIGDHLGQPVMVAQIDEQHAAVVADAVAPAGQPHVLSDVAVAKRAAGVGAVAVHARVPENRCKSRGEAAEKHMQGGVCQGERRAAGPCQSGLDFPPRTMISRHLFPLRSRRCDTGRSPAGIAAGSD